MGARDPRIDAYIEKSADFARPILRQLREVVHTACPEVQETMKWSFPHFMYSGRILCSMASFKQHCAFGFWRGDVVVKEGEDRGASAMGQFGRIASPDDLPPTETLTAYIQEAMRVAEAGSETAPRARKRPKAEIAVPDYFTIALESAPAARETFERFSPSHRREYLEWITEAKTEATRQRRLDTAVEWMSQGKPRNWKYARS